MTSVRRKWFAEISLACYYPAMNRDIRVHLLPALFEPEEVRGGVAVILDILRASTTIVHALANGADCVIPMLSVEDAQQSARGLAAPQVLLGGEREGILINGFHLDNNPFAYGPDVVRGKTIVFTTTNGTKALHRAAMADRVLIGAFVNLQAVVDVLAADSRPIHLVCAGTKGKITIEDALCAGAIIDRLLEEFGRRDDDLADDQAQLALHRYLAASTSDAEFLRAMRNSYGGRNCRNLGFNDQIARAATFDLFDIVPEYDAGTGKITQ
ncbi:MAG TPA: 2-phosphosulfolactate phosphatase [Planctomycetaceae bacterium]|nr:2-phosphosulfolactate phosphatase [Planctomycetaceae bacterium]